MAQLKFLDEEGLAQVRNNYMGAIQAAVEVIDEELTSIKNILGISDLNKEDSNVASNSYSIGQYFIFNNRLCKATAAIDIQDAINISVNCEYTSIIEMLM